MPPSPADERITVVHLGNDADSVRGGIAAVIRQHLSNPDERLSVSAIATYDPNGRGHLSRNVPYARALRWVVAGRGGRSAVAHVHLSQGGSLVREGLLVGLLRLRRIPVVVTLHGSSSLSNGRVPFVLTGLVLRLASVAHFLSDAHRRRYGRFTGRHVTVPNAVPVDPAPATNRQPDVVFAGVVGTRKGVDVLLKAWQALPSAGWTLHLYGPPDSDFPLPRDIPGVVAHGEVTPDAVQQALATASIAVLPSREEAFPMFLVEAMAQGCAIVATDVGGVRELMGEGGLLVRADDADALGDALARLISEPGTRAEFAGAAGARAADRFDAGPVARQWADTYASLAVGTPTSQGGACRG
jgi:glycosyltransferase involved in cell wall biosynthesis